MTHPKTGHEGHTRKPQRWEDKPPVGPLTIRIAKDMACDIEPLSSRVCQRGTKACWVDHDEMAAGPDWIAEIDGIHSDGTPAHYLTHGPTPAKAVQMAYDLLSMVYDECVDDDGHCYCRDGTYSFGDTIWRCVDCCRCKTRVTVSEFEDA